VTVVELSNAECDAREIMSKLERDGAAFNVVDEGNSDAPPIMLAHALGCDHAMWDWQLPSLLRRYRVIRYDVRGHGGSASPRGPYSLETLGLDAVAILDALGIERAHWLGLSMGGVIGEWLLTHAPQRVGRAILANTAAYLGPPGAWDARINAVMENGVGAIAPSVIERWFTKEFCEREPQTVARIYETLRSSPADGYVACAAALRDMDLRDEIRHVRAPVLVIVGRRDPSTPPEFGAQIARAIQSARLVTLEAAHLSNIEAAEAFNRAMMDFLEAS
jgi:3-oxoadipate enol-lactonase